LILVAVQEYLILNKGDNLGICQLICCNCGNIFALDGGICFPIKCDCGSKIHFQFDRSKYASNRNGLKMYTNEDSNESYECATCGFKVHSYDCFAKEGDCPAKGCNGKLVRVLQ
jgi:hypothetical protein